jgi:hypothetical protein
MPDLAASAQPRVEVDDSQVPTLLVAQTRDAAAPY